jgi:hypothetical protein
VGQPAHDDLPRPDHLLPVDAQVLPQPRLGHVLRAARHHQAPGDQRAGVTRPAGLHRQARQVDGVAFQHLGLARCLAQHRWLHVPHRLGHGQQLARVLQAARRVRLLQRRQQAAHVTQFQRRRCPHAQGHPFRCAEQVDQHGHAVAGRLREEHRGAAGAQQLVANGRHFQARRHRIGHALELAPLLQLGQEVAKVSVFHTDSK